MEGKSERPLGPGDMVPPMYLELVRRGALILKYCSTCEVPMVDMVSGTFHKCQEDRSADWLDVMCKIVSKV